MKVKLEKAGTNSLQRPTTWLIGDDYDEFPLAIGDTFHIEGQPDDVLWTVVSIVGDLCSQPENDIVPPPVHIGS